MNNKQLQILSPSSAWKDYELVDSGGFEKLERFGKYVLRRPEPKAVWAKSMPEKEWVKLADTTFTNGAGFGKSGKGKSFADIFGQMGLIDALPECDSERVVMQPPEGHKESDEAEPVSDKVLTHADTALPQLPKRVLPHQLAHFDATRGARHEATADELNPAIEGDEAIDYGTWWHEVMELLPWAANDTELDAYFKNAANSAMALGQIAVQRGCEELTLLRGSPVLRDLRDARWTREAELPVFAPANGSGDAWIDGIMDLVIHDPASNEARVIDWKTNRRRTGESDETLLARLADEYTPQLCAYGRCVRLFFPDARVRLFVYSSAAGKMIEISGLEDTV